MAAQEKTRPFNSFEIAQAQFDRVAELTGAKISLVGIGPSRDQTLVV